MNTNNKNLSTPTTESLESLSKFDCSHNKLVEMGPIPELTPEQELAQTEALKKSVEGSFNFKASNSEGK